MWDSEVGGSACGDLEPAHIAAFVRRLCNGDPIRIVLDVQPLRGGLESRAVARVQAEITAGRGTPRRFTFVVKRLDGPGNRELAVYDLLGVAGARPIPAVLGVQSIGPSTSYLFLEWIASSRWPWAEPSLVADVLEQLAQLHSLLSIVGLPGALSAWDYESELLALAGVTLNALESAADNEGFAGLRRLIAPLRRVVAALPGMRRQLLSANVLGQAVLHGDVHSGNVLVRDTSLRRSAVLVDWARARLGSPLEDVSSWLESLGFWEPGVRQHRASLVRRYLQARGLPTAAAHHLDLWYWVAAASNALAGALYHHIQQALRASADSGSTHRTAALRAARDHLYAIERADVLWAEYVVPQMLMIVKSAHVAGPVGPLDDRQAGVVGAEGFPTGSARAVEGAHDLADDARVCDDDHPLAGMPGGDEIHGAQDATTEIAVAFAAGPVEAVIGLPQIGGPMEGIASLHLTEQHALEAAAVDLAQ